MNCIEKEIVEKAKEFLSSVEECSLVYHGDSDGVCSAALIYKFLKNKVKMASTNDSYGIHVTEHLIERLNDTKKTIIVDLAANQWDYKKIKSGVLLIDHHSTKKDLNKEKNFIHANPRIENPDAYIPASLLVYDLLRSIDKNMEKYAWIAGVGVIGDKGDFERVETKEKFEDLEFISHIIESNKGVYRKKGIEKAYEVLKDAETPKDVLDSSLIKAYHKFQKAVNDTILDFKYHSQYFEKKNAYIYKVYNKYKLTSVVATILSSREPDAAFFIYKRDKVLSMSGRCQSARINLAKLMEKLTEGIGSGGGHPPAAAASIPIENADKFMERLTDFLEGID